MQYTLTEREKTTVEKLRKQLDDAQRIIDQAKSQLTAVQGAMQGAAFIIASQQELLKTGEETIRFDSNFETIIVD
jgi:hypothetical protein